MLPLVGSAAHTAPLAAAILWLLGNLAIPSAGSRPWAALGQLFQDHFAPAAQQQCSGVSAINQKAGEALDHPVPGS